MESAPTHSSELLRGSSGGFSLYQPSLPAWGPGRHIHHDLRTPVQLYKAHGLSLAGSADPVRLVRAPALAVQLKRGHELRGTDRGGLVLGHAAEPRGGEWTRPGDRGWQRQ